MLLQYYVILSPRDAERMIWNRAHKNKESHGGNIPLDLALEHYNRVLKTGMRNMGPNNTNPKSIERFCKALVVNRKLLGNFDRMVHTTSLSSLHRAKNMEEDLNVIVKELLDKRALEFTEVSKRFYYIIIL